MRETVFLLSPAHCGGRRAEILLRDGAEFPLARRLAGTRGAPLGDVFSFLSGLYFRGKLAYARSFQSVARGRSGVLVITPGLGLVSPARAVTLDGLRTIAAVGVDPDDPEYREPFERDAARLARRMKNGGRVVLLGSLATDKYTSVLRRSLGARLHYPLPFVGRGDMSRGGLLLRCVREARELEYAPLDAGRLRLPASRV